MTGAQQTLVLSDKHAKILAAMYALAPDSPRMLRYEDIVVKAFELFRTEFQLRGYPQYPDASDIHKPLYGPLKRLGLVTAANKRFRLTQRGLEVAQRMAGAGATPAADKVAGHRLGRDAAAEVRRLLSSPAYRLISEGKSDEIVDSDFYAFFRVTVRTPRNDFIGRIAAVKGAVAEAVANGGPEVGRLQEVVDFLTSRYHPIVDAKSKE